MRSVVFLIPVFNDATALNATVQVLEQKAKRRNETNCALLVIDDGSHQEITLQTQWPATIIQMHRNMGHQKAIAIGLSYACEKLSPEYVCVMDCDGEDLPDDAFDMLEISRQNNKVVLAKRNRRKERWQFILFYRFYKLLFHFLTGKNISFGNFMVISKSQALRLIYHSELWMHLAGSILRSNIPILTYPTDRGQRVAGKSKMNFNALMLHGLGGIGVFIDVIASRLLVLSLSLILGSSLAILILFYIKAFSNLAIPGWTSTVLTSMLIVLLQSFLLSLFTIFLYLTSQTQRKFIPALHYSDYIQSIRNGNHER